MQSCNSCVVTNDPRVVFTLQHVFPFGLQHFDFKYGVHLVNERKEGRKERRKKGKKKERQRLWLETTSMLCTTHPSFFFLWGGLTKCAKRSLPKIPIWMSIFLFSSQVSFEEVALYFFNMVKLSFFCFWYKRCTVLFNVMNGSPIMCKYRFNIWTSNIRCCGVVGVWNSPLPFFPALLNAVVDCSE